jgi:uncharacterized protein DUF2877
VPTTPAAASTAVRDLLAGPPRPARVLAVFPTALYVESGGEVAAVVTADALRLPFALVVAVDSSQQPFAAVRPADGATVGDGVVRVGAFAGHAARWWQPRRPTPLRPDATLPLRLRALDAVLAAAPPLPAPVGDRLAGLTRALVAADAGAAAAAVRSLVGLGPGLTPAGDDVVAALLLTLSVSPAADLSAALARDVVGYAAPRTSALSAALLRHAMDGCGIPQVTDLVDALGGRGDLTSAVDRLLAVGHSSGAALAHGILAAGRVILAPGPVRSEVAS